MPPSPFASKKGEEKKKEGTEEKRLHLVIFQNEIDLNCKFDASKIIWAKPLDPFFVPLF